MPTGRTRRSSPIRSWRRTKRSMWATSSRWWSPTRRLQARDAAELISVTWDELPAVTDMEEAASRPDAPLVFAGAPGNVAYDTHIGDKEKTDKRVRAARRTRFASKSSTRASSPITWSRARRLANMMRQSGRFTLNVGSQGVHGIQGVIAGDDPENSARILARRHAGRRRRIRHQGRRLSRISARSRGGEAARAIGRLARRSQRAFRRRRARPRQCDDG